MEFEVTTSVYVDIDEIIKENGITSETSLKNVHDMVTDYIAGMDDYEYCLANEVLDEIVDAIMAQTGHQMTLKGWD